MELKRLTGIPTDSSNVLLIVPYGIETNTFLCVGRSKELLIVPYGIETDILARSVTAPPTFNCTLWNWNHYRSMFIDEVLDTFNCTLWNWNNTIPFGNIFGIVLLIVPYGIETDDASHLNVKLRNLLIVPYGIETTSGRRRCVEAGRLLIVPYGIET